MKNVAFFNFNTSLQVKNKLISLDITPHARSYVLVGRKKKKENLFFQARERSGIKQIRGKERERERERERETLMWVAVVSAVCVMYDTRENYGTFNGYDTTSLCR